MNEFLSEKRLPKITPNKYYLNKDKILVRVLKVNKRDNRVTLYRYDTFEKEDVELDTAPYYFTPLFKIGEVAQMLNRSPDTIRRYESSGLLPKARQFSVSEVESPKTRIRLYSEKDLLELADFFANRRSVGRPAKTNSKINRKELNEQLNSRFKQIRQIPK